MHYKIISRNNFMDYKLTSISIRGLHISILSVYSNTILKKLTLKTLNSYCKYFAINSFYMHTWMSDLFFVFIQIS